MAQEQAQILKGSDKVEEVSTKMKVAKTIPIHCLSKFISSPHPCSI